MKQKYLPTAEAWEQAYGVVPHKVTILRAIRRGLHAVKIGNRWYSTVDSVIDYTERLSTTGLKSLSPLTPPKNQTSFSRTDAQRAKDFARAKKELENG